MGYDLAANTELVDKIRVRQSQTVKGSAVFDYGFPESTNYKVSDPNDVFSASHSVLYEHMYAFINTYFYIKKRIQYMNLRHATQVTA